RDRPDGDRREREERGYHVQPSALHSEREQEQQEREERRDSAQRHQDLEGRVVRASRKHRGRKEDGERSGRVLDEDVPVRKLAAEELVRVDPVEVYIAVALGTEESAVGQRARREEDG